MNVGTLCACEDHTHVNDVFLLPAKLAVFAGKGSHTKAEKDGPNPCITNMQLKKKMS